MTGRIPILDVWPSVGCGRYPAKAVVGESFPVSATVFREGHDAVAANVVLRGPDGQTGPWTPMRPLPPGDSHVDEAHGGGTDRWVADAVPTAPGDWTYAIEAWSDSYGTWRHDAEIKVPAGVDVEIMLEEGARLFERAAALEGRDSAGTQALRDAVAALRDASRPPEARLAAGRSAAVVQTLSELPVRDLVTSSERFPLLVERQRALYGSWYEFFPRSEGAVVDPTTGAVTSGTLRTAAERLPAVAAMGFDVIYLPPIHPIGETNRKGPNNTLTPGPADPGSPWAIGSAYGGHDAVHPELGTLEDFDAFVAEAQRLGLEVALDFALQCAPDHPWVKEHPDWFTVLADGSIAYAENPPKKYQDIYPLNFDKDPAGL
jgi:starch synthase (maltosyl-transferring)